MDCEYLPITEDDSEISKILFRHFVPKFRPGYVRFGPEKVMMPKYYLEFKDAVDNFEVRPDDIWVTSYPKSGSTWTSEMVWCIANNLDFVGAQQKLAERIRFFEISALFDYRNMQNEMPPKLPDGYVKNSVQLVNDLKSPRFIKTHLPWQIMPKQLRDGPNKPRIIYVSRNPKDACLSFYYQCKLLKVFTGSFEEFAKLFLNDSISFMPFWNHILSFWKRRHEPNILFLRFEDMKKDLPSVIRQTADFLGKTLTEFQVDILADHLSFAKMKDNTAVEEDIHKPSELRFMRKGEVGQWKTDMSPELVEQFDKWIEAHTKDTGLTF